MGNAKKRTRVQAQIGEVLTSEEGLLKLRDEEVARNAKKQRKMGPKSGTSKQAEPSQVDSFQVEIQAESTQDASQQTIPDMINNYVKKITLQNTIPEQERPKRFTTQCRTQKKFSKVFKKYTAIKRG